jgi:hypothetical protein
MKKSSVRFLNLSEKQSLRKVREEMLPRLKIPIIPLSQRRRTLPIQNRIGRLQRILLVVPWHVNILLFLSPAQTAIHDLEKLDLTLVLVHIALCDERASVHRVNGLKMMAEELTRLRKAPFLVLSLWKISLRSILRWSILNRCQASP